MATAPTESTSPASSAVYPMSVCSSCGMSTVELNRTAPSIRNITLLVAKLEFLNSRTSTIGSLCRPRSDLCQFRNWSLVKIGRDGRNRSATARLECPAFVLEPERNRTSADSTTGTHNYFGSLEACTLGESNLQIKVHKIKRLWRIGIPADLSCPCSHALSISRSPHATR